MVMYGLSSPATRLGGVCRWRVVCGWEYEYDRIRADLGVGVRANVWLSDGNASAQSRGGGRDVRWLDQPGGRGRG